MKRPFVAMFAAVVAITGIGSSAAFARDGDYGRDAGFQRVQHNQGPDGRRWDRDRREDHERVRVEEYRRPRGYEARHWAPGYRLPPSYRAARYVVVEPARYHLRPAPRGHQWIRVNSDVLLVASRTGVIVKVVPGLFR